MSKKPDPAPTDAENPEWGSEEFAGAKRLHEMPPEFQAAIKRARAPQKAPTKVPISIRVTVR